MLRIVAAIFLALASSIGARAQTADCHAGQKPRQVAELLFGRNIGDRLGVSEAQWGRFVDREISPRFPDGLTVLDAKGEWRDTARHTIVHEPSKLVEIVLPGKDDDADAARGDRAGLQIQVPPAIRRHRGAGRLRVVLGSA